MNNYILQLLKEIKTIIIPGIGALTLTNEATGEFLFMSYLSYDDGKLAASISEKEGMDLNDAKNLVSKFTREVLAVIEKGESYDMYQFGKFSKVDGEIVFDQWQSGLDTTSSIPETIVVSDQLEENIQPLEQAQAIDEEPLIEKKQTVVDPNITNVIASEPIVVEPIAVEPIIELPVEEKVEMIVPTISDTIERTEIELLKEEIIAEQEKAVEPETQKEPTPKVETPIVQKANKKVKVQNKKAIQTATKAPSTPRKTSKLSYAIWGVLVLLFGAGTYVFVNFDNLKGDFPILAELAGENDTIAKGAADLKTLSDDSTALKPEKEVVPEPIPEEEIPEIEPIPEPEPVVVPEPIPVKAVVVSKPAPKTVVVSKPVPSQRKTPVQRTTPPSQNFPSIDSSKPFHLIAGSFSSENNAKRFATQLKSKGMSELSIGEKAGVFRVSIKGFASKAEASAAAQGVQNVAPGAWVLLWE